jgi:hypothetical protein
MSLTNERHRRVIAYTQNLLMLTNPLCENARRIERHYRDSVVTLQGVLIQPMSGFLGIFGFECRFQGWYENGKTLAQPFVDRPYDLTAVYQPDYTPLIIEILLLALVVTLASLIAIFGLRDWWGKLERARSSLQARLSSTRQRPGPTALVTIILLIIILAFTSLTLAVMTLILGRKEPHLITWRETEPSRRRAGVTQIVVARIDVSGVLDPVTGTGFSDGESAWRCTNCQMFYHNQTYRFLRDQNFRCCVGCGQTSLERSRVGTAKRARTKPQRPPSPESEIRQEFTQRPREQTLFQPPAVRLVDISQHIGHVVYFQGRVVEVQRSRNANTYCVKFQRGPWARVFKLVVFPNYVSNFTHGEQTIRDYARKSIRVRGLVQLHPEWGLEILVYDETAITVLE